MVLEQQHVHNRCWSGLPVADSAVLKNRTPRWKIRRGVLSFSARCKSRQGSWFANENLICARRSGSRCTYSGFEEVFYARQNFRRALRFVDLFPQMSAARNAVREPRSELLHLAHSVREFFLDQHREISADHLIAVSLGGLVVARPECGDSPPSLP